MGTKFRVVVAYLVLALTPLAVFGTYVYATTLSDLRTRKLAIKKEVAVSAADALGTQLQAIRQLAVLPGHSGRKPRACLVQGPSFTVRLPLDASVAMRR